MWSDRSGGGVNGGIVVGGSLVGVAGSKCSSRLHDGLARQGRGGRHQGWQDLRAGGGRRLRTGLPRTGSRSRSHGDLGGGRVLGPEVNARDDSDADGQRRGDHPTACLPYHPSPWSVGLIPRIDHSEDQYDRLRPPG